MSTSPVALITGANRGIGLAMARQLGEHEFSVWLACRSADDGQPATEELRAAGIDAHFVALDVTSDAGVATAAALVGAEVAALDLLINNAAMNFGPPGHPSGEDLDQIREMFETNTFGSVRVTQAFLPLLRRSAAARVIMMTSGLGSVANTLDPTSENWNVAFAGYSASKSALNMFAVKFAKELLAEGIKVNVVDPGLSQTGLGGPLATQSATDGARAAVTLATADPTFGPTAGFFVRQLPVPLLQHPW